MSGKAGSGKDTAARFIKEALEEKGFKVLELAYADYLKAIVNRNFVYETEEEYRNLLQGFGTEYVRSFENDFWVNVVFHTVDLLAKRYNEKELEALHESIKNVMGDNVSPEEIEEDFNKLKDNDNRKYDAFIITDARYKNELQPKIYTIAYNIHNIKIDREDTNFRMTEEQRQHSSEQLATDDTIDFFATIFNDGSIEELEACCYSVIQDVLEDRDEKYQELLDEAKRYLEEQNS